MKNNPIKTTLVSPIFGANPERFCEEMVLTKTRFFPLIHGISCRYCRQDREEVKTLFPRDLISVIMSANTTNCLPIDLPTTSTVGEDSLKLSVQGVIKEIVSGVEGILHSLPTESLSLVGQESRGESLPKENDVPKVVKKTVSCFDFDEEEETQSDFRKDSISTFNPRFLGKRRLPPKPASVAPLLQNNLFSPVTKKSKTSEDERDQVRPSVGYVFSKEVLKEANRIPKVKGRASNVHELITSYHLTSLMEILSSKPASEEDLRSFHSGGYIDYIKSIDDKKKETDEDGLLETSFVGEEFGLGYDCPTFPDLFNFAREIAGSTMTAVKAVLEGKCKIALNFHGGWHHSKPAEASGFCYVNDIVIGILYALQQPEVEKVLYLDFDLHHGDAVQDAFAHSSRVMTVSFHKYEVAFFPGTGALHDIGNGKGKGYSINVPLRDGITDDNYRTITKKVLTDVYGAFNPDLVVAQFGADGIANDPMQSFNLTPDSLVDCLRQIKYWKKPTVILGGGGYNFFNTAKTWTRLTAAALGLQLPQEIPDHRYFLEYGPSFEITVEPTRPRDQNDEKYLSDVSRTINKMLSIHVVKNCAVPKKVVFGESTTIYIN